MSGTRTPSLNARSATHVDISIIPSFCHHICLCLILLFGDCHFVVFVFVFVLVFVLVFVYVFVFVIVFEFVFVFVFVFVSVLFTLLSPCM
jgi:hypothetical protein